MGFGKGSRGPRKKVDKPASPVVSTAIEEQAEPVKASNRDKVYYFKSKFKRDGITLIKPQNIKHDDGTRTVNPGKVAEFDHNTWTTTDSRLAGILRNIINERPDLGVMETTSD